MLINKDTLFKLCDFGISRNFDDMKVDSEGIAGTADYIPPRLGRAIQDDMWALGISLIEIINGEHPFAKWESHGKFIKILMWNPVVPTTISGDMQQLILHL
jgi:serine/threonine protein kinase